MNASLLALNAAANTGPAVAGATPGTPQLGPETDQSEAGFAQLLEQAAGGQLLPGATASAPPGTEESAENAAVDELVVETETDNDSEAGWAAVAVSLSPLLPSVPTVTESADETAAPLTASALAARIGLAIAPTAGEGSAQTPDLTLPLAGKRLPAAVADQAAGASTEAALASEATATDLAQAALVDDSWSSLLDGALAGAAGQGRADSALAMLRGRAEPAISSSGINALATPTATATTDIAGTDALDNVPGIAVRSPHFATLLGNQVLWQARVGNQHAEIRLDPPELGPIEVRISQKDSETHLHFVVGHHATREQLEQAMPRLRELFGQGGLQLGQVAVEQGQRETPSDREQRALAAGAASGNGDHDEPPVMVTRPISTSLIDAYA
ncbi:MAG: flagellar hook-length control protein FliK [Pseudomonadota bacterium]